MSDGEKTRVEFRYDEDGSLTVWGARDVLLDVGRKMITEALADEGVRIHPKVFTDSGLKRIEQALDDVEDAYLRCHDEFGCVGLNGGRADDEHERYICTACRSTAEPVKDAPVKEEAQAEMTSDHRLDDVINVGSVTLPVWVSRSDLPVDMEWDNASAPLIEERTRSGQRVHVGTVSVEVPVYADALDDEDYEVNEALRDAARRRRRLLTDADETRRRIREGVHTAAGTPPPPGGWDAVADIRSERSGTCGTSGARQDAQSGAEAVDGATPAGWAGWLDGSLQRALDVRPGDQVNVTLEMAADGRVAVRSLYVARADELEVEDIISEIGD